MGDIRLGTGQSVPPTWKFGYVDIGDRFMALVQEASETWRTAQMQDEEINDSDKTFTVPAHIEWEILGIWVELTTDVTVGDRQLVIEVQDVANDVIGQWARVGAIQAASLTRYYMLAPCLPDMVAFRDTNYLTTPIPATPFLKETDQLRIYDNKAIAAATDDMVVQINYAWRYI